jgi:predicted RNA-binding protein YlqC (UPF0109 family)
MGRVQERQVSDDVEEFNAATAPTAVSVCEHVVKALVDDPDSVSIEPEERRRGGIILRVNVAQDDMGRVIGRRGRTAQAVRTLVAAAAVRDGVEVDVDFVD